MTQEFLSFSDLPGLGSSPDDVKSKFKQTFGREPDGIALNNDTYYDGAVKPPITQTFSKYCHKRLGEFQFTEDSREPPTDAVVGKNTAINYGDEEAEISVTVVGTWTEQTGWSSELTTGLTFSTEFNIEGAFKMGLEFSISATAGKSGSSSLSKSSSSTVNVKVPPKSKKKVEMVATMKKERMNFKVPIAVDGAFGANFDPPLNGHYFWFMDARAALPKTSGEISGTITGTTALEVRTEIYAAEPI